MRDKNIIDAFFALVRGGLWEQQVDLTPFWPLDFDALYKLADEQSVVGLVAAGIEHVENLKVNKHQIRPFLTHVISIESNNSEMNHSISWLWNRFHEEHIAVALVKGQGVAQCYERPLWRSPGDIDLLLDSESYVMAKELLCPIAQLIHTEKKKEKHLALTVRSLTIELHGTLHTGQSRKLDSIIDDVQDEMFKNSLFREWDIDHTLVSLPSPDCDVIFVFSRILQHFYKGGIGLRQICDLSRLLWTYKDTINRPLLYNRLQAMGITREWVAFMSFAVVYVGLPQEVAPFYSKPNSGLSRIIASFIIETGNFGRSRDNGYRQKGYPVTLRKSITLLRQIKDNIRLIRVSPVNSIRFTLGYIRSQIND